MQSDTTKRGQQSGDPAAQLLTVLEAGEPLAALSGVERALLIVMCGLPMWFSTRRLGSAFIGKRAAVRRLFPPAHWKPSIGTLDQATSALEADYQAGLMELFMRQLSEASVISVHSPLLAPYHSRQITVRTEKRTSRLGANGSANRLGQAARRHGAAGQGARQLKAGPANWGGDAECS
jgi:hypothetical protein